MARSALKKKNCGFVLDITSVFVHLRPAVHLQPLISPNFLTHYQPVLCATTEKHVSKNGPGLSYVGLLFLLQYYSNPKRELRNGCFPISKRPSELREA
jgi:hypothetical protein